MKNIPETKARMVLWGRMWPMLLRMKPMNMKKRLTRGKGVAERIISVERGAEQGENRLIFPKQCEKWAWLSERAPTPLLRLCCV